jgi:hypothetical protein
MTWAVPGIPFTFRFKVPKLRICRMVLGALMEKIGQLALAVYIKLELNGKAELNCKCLRQDYPCPVVFPADADCLSCVLSALEVGISINGVTP